MKTPKACNTNPEPGYARPTLPAHTPGSPAEPAAKVAVAKAAYVRASDTTANAGHQQHGDCGDCGGHQGGFVVAPAWETVAYVVSVVTVVLLTVALFAAAAGYLTTFYGA